jgi:3-hydroxymyristoyl/3-hydroxydecanoyl-(acyl carrier protein) dehydratase
MPASLDHDAVRAMLPYREPMLMIDRVLDWSDAEITVEKAVSALDPIVSSHLIFGPQVMPGVLLIELVGQGAYLHTLLRNGADIPAECDSIHAQPQARLLGRCKARYLRPARVGHTIVANIVHVGSALNGAVHRGRLTVDDELVAEIEVISALAPDPDRSTPLPDGD